MNENNEPIKVFSDQPEAMATLQDARYQFVDVADDAQIFWLIGQHRAAIRPKAIEKNAYLNEIPSDEVLLVKDLFVALQHSSFNCFKP